MTQIQNPTEKLTAEDHCESCEAPLSPDQRYCLECGKRRGEARVDFRRHLAQPTAQQAQTVATASASPAPAARVLTPITIIGSIATLGVMLVLGVLIGKDNNSTTVQAPVASTNPPKVVVQAGPSSGEPTATDTSGKTSAKPGKTTGSAPKDTSKVASKTQAAGPVDTGNAPTVGDEALGALDTGDTAANAKASANLPDTVATEGTPDKPDNKAPGAGTSATVIK